LPLPTLTSIMTRPCIGPV